MNDLFSLSSSFSSSKRSRTNQITANDRDEFDDLFETCSSIKRRRTNNNNNKQLTDVFDFDISSTSTNKIKNEKLNESVNVKRNLIDDDENKIFDELFNNDTRRKLRRPIKDDDSTDLLDMFKTRTNTSSHKKISTIDNFETSIDPKNSTTQKKIKMFFDDTDLVSLREQTNQLNDIVSYFYLFFPCVRLKKKSTF